MGEAERLVQAKDLMAQTRCLEEHLLCDTRIPKRDIVHTAINMARNTPRSANRRHLACPLWTQLSSQTSSGAKKHMKAAKQSSQALLTNGFNHLLTAC